VDVGHASLLVLDAVDERLDAAKAVPLHDVLDDLLELLVEDSHDGHWLVDELLIGEEGVLDLWPLRIARPGEETEKRGEESVAAEGT
jgi:hypothetical protein